MEPETLSKSREDFLMHSNSDQRHSSDRQIIDQIQLLSKNIRLSCEKNCSYYNRIVKANPHFTHNLYNPPIHLNTKKSQVHLTKNLLVRQMDNLLEQENLFLRELNKIQFRQEQEQFSKDCHLERQLGHYHFLKNVWKRTIVAIDSEDRIEKLNKSVALIKGHIITMNKKEQADSSLSSHNTIIQSFVVNSKEYMELKQRYDKLLIEWQQQIGKNSTGTLKQKLSIRSTGQDIVKLEEQNQQLRNQVHQYKQKLKSLQKVSLKNKIRTQQLQEQIYTKEREIHKLTKDIRITYKNQTQQYQIQVISKNLSGKEQKKLQKTLQQILTQIQSIQQSTGSDKDRLINLPLSSHRMLSGAALSARTPLVCRIEAQGNQNQLSPNNKLASTNPQFFERKRFSHVHLDIANPQHTRRLKSISDANVQTQLKKTRFIRTGTRNNLQEAPKNERVYNIKA